MSSHPSQPAAAPGALVLVPARAEHAELFLRWRADPTTRRFNPLVELTVDAARARLEHEGEPLSSFDEVDAFRWFAERDGEPVATVALQGVNRVMAFGELAYGVAPEHRGQGVGSAAVRAAVSLVLAGTPLRRLVAYVHEENVASRRLLERLGFACEGLLREHYVVEGRPVNEAVYGLLAREWRG